jgi:hypothetical protein
MMYLLFARHNIKPSDWYNMGPGERIILRAFILKELEEEKKLRDEMNK